MKKKLLSICLLVLIFTISACSFQPRWHKNASSLSTEELYSEEIFSDKLKKNLEETSKKYDIKKIEDDGKGLLEVGESVTMSIRWWGVEAGKATITVKDLVEINGRKAYHVEALAQTSSVVDLVYKVRDVHETYIDAENLYTLRYIRNASEGRHVYNETYDFDYKNKKVTFTDRDKDQVKEYDMPEDMRDIISVCYWYRYQDFEIGKQFRTIVHSDQKNYEVTFHVRGKDNLKNEEKTPVFVIEPKVKKGDKDYMKGRGSVLVTASPERIPIMAKMKVIFAGSLHIVMESRENIYAGKAA